MLAAVVTADIVNSIKLFESHPQFIQELKTLIKTDQQLSIRGSTGLIQFSPLFRGDSFQVFVPDARLALGVALLLKARTSQKKFGTQRLDLRFSIGIGEVTAPESGAAIEGHGEAFYLSGYGMDNNFPKRYRRYRRLSILTPSPELNREMELMAILLDAVTQGWSQKQAVVFSGWLQGQTQEQLAAELNVSQPAINLHLNRGGAFAIEYTLKHYAEQLEQL